VSIQEEDRTGQRLLGQQAMDSEQHDRLAGGANDEASHPGARGSSGSNNRRTLPSSSSAGSKAQAHPRGSLEVDGHDPDGRADLEHHDDEDEEEEGEDESGRMAAAGPEAASSSKGERLSEEAMEGRVHRRYA
jgi:hypothetical protein